MNTQDINSVTAFAKACHGKSSDFIYDLFENKLSDDVRDRIYSHAEEGNPEPARSAFNTIGSLMNVLSLKYY